MNIKSFFKLVEIQTKVASIIPLITGIIYTVYKYNRFDFILILLFFISMISIDMATTAINNYMDFKKAIKKDGYNYEEHNAMVRDNVTSSSALITIIILIFISTVFGIILVLLTDWLVLFVGIVSFLIGISYSFGPLPISRTPLGELFSGVTMGGIITFIAVYMQVLDYSIIDLSLSRNNISLSVKYIDFLSILFISLPNIFMISNIMLANNICDIEDDTANNRFTLPIYIGKNLALILFTSLYIFTYLVIIGAVVLKVVPVFSLITLITIVPVAGNIKIFRNNIDKATTFALSVKNFIIVSLFFILSLVLGILL